MEPLPTAVLLAIFGALMAASALMTRSVARVGVPTALLFLVLGMLGGSEGIGGLHFSDASVAFRLGTVALIFILLDGGFNTPVASIRQVVVPATLLATVGVVGTAVVVYFAARLFGVPWEDAMLIGAIVSSTDAAAVFGVLRGGNLALKPRVQATLEVESCANDPMAVILTLTAIDFIRSGAAPTAFTVLDIVLQLVIGVAVGLLAGHVTRWLLNRVRLSAVGLYPVVTLAAACSAFGIATLVHGSGFMAVFVAGVVLGNGHLPHMAGLRRVQEAFAWISQVSMFLMLGLLVFPSKLVPVAGVGIGLGVVLAVVARPLAVALCLAVLRWPVREVAYVCWVGLRGAVPIILATFPIMAGLPSGDRVFHVVFFIVVVSALLPGATIIPATFKLGIGGRSKPEPGAALELNAIRNLERPLVRYHLRPSDPGSGHLLRDLEFPEGAAVVLVVRGDEPIAARGHTRLEVDDYVHVVCQPGDLPAVDALLGVREA